MKKLIAAAIAALAATCLPAAANATVFLFKGDPGHDVPLGNAAPNCGSVGVDLCTIDHSLGFAYAKDGLTVTAKAFKNGAATLLIQDLTPIDSGLGAFSENDQNNDQTQFNSGESISFEFDQEVRLTNIEFNAGNDVNCSAPGPEGPCGFFDLFIDGNFFGNIEAVDLLTTVFIGSLFNFVATTPNAGFAIAQFEVQPVPVPGALPLLLSGIAGLGFASRRRKS